MQESVAFPAFLKKLFIFCKFSWKNGFAAQLQVKGAVWRDEGSAMFLTHSDRYQDKLLPQWSSSDPHPPQQHSRDTGTQHTWIQVCSRGEKALDRVGKPKSLQSRRGWMEKLPLSTSGGSRSHQSHAIPDAIPTPWALTAHPKAPSPHSPHSWCPAEAPGGADRHVPP